MASEGEDYPSGSHVFTVPKYDEPADAPQAFKNFADSITDGLGLDFDAARAGQVVQADDSKDWAAGPVMKVVGDLPADDDAGYVIGDVVFVTGPGDGGSSPVGGGKVLQVVRETDSSLRTTNSTSFVDVAGMSVTITPQKSDSAGRPFGGAVLLVMANA